MAVHIKYLSSTFYPKIVSVIVSSYHADVCSSAIFSDKIGLNCFVCFLMLSSSDKSGSWRSVNRLYGSAQKDLQRVVLWRIGW